jgi:hypothetical protein
MTIDIWAMPIVTEFSAAAGITWDDYEASVAMCIQLARYKDKSSDGCRQQIRD